MQVVLIIYYASKAFNKKKRKERKKGRSKYIDKEKWHFVVGGYLGCCDILQL